MKKGLFCFICWLLLLGALPLHAEEIEEVSPLRVELISEQESIQPGHPFWVLLKINLDEGWHVYWKNPGDVGIPITVNWNLPKGFEAKEVLWPTPIRFQQGSVIGFGYEKEVLALVQITPKEEVVSGSTASLTANLDWLTCSLENCLPGDASISLDLPVSGAAARVNAAAISLFAEARKMMPREGLFVEAIVTKEGMEVVFDAPSSMPVEGVEVFFFPEESKVFDPHQELRLSKVDTKPERYVVGPIAFEAENETPEVLRGILVLKSLGKTFSYQIEHKLAEEEQAALKETKKMADFVSHIPQEIRMDFEGGFAFALLLAFLGGISLNLMPCVLPVISLKILSFLNLAGKSRTLIWQHGLLFTLGVVLSFWALAGFLLVLRSYGQAVGWGFQLQDPLFVGLLACFLLVFSLSFFGVFTFGNKVASLVGQAEAKQANDEKSSLGLFGSFVKGVVATTVATPCTGPFLGSAMGFALTLSPLAAMVIFTSLGLGMASPYLVLTFFPNLLVYLPKPGVWMETFRQLMGFILLATVLWLVWVFAALTEDTGIMGLLCAFLLLSFGSWAFGTWSSPFQKKPVRLAAVLAAALCFVGGGVMTYQASSCVDLAVCKKLNAERAKRSPVAHSDWEPFSKERVAELRAQGVPVFVDFTAKWCLICQANLLTLESREVGKKFSERRIVKMKADWTKSDPSITEELRKYGRSGVPLYLLFDSNLEKPPLVLPQVLTPEVVADYLNKVDNHSPVDYPLASHRAD